jgi:hypothetical protein
MIAIGVEPDYISVAILLSGWGPKGKLNTPITTGSEVMDFLRLLKLIRWSDSSMIAIGVELDYRSVGRSLSGWGTKGEPNAWSPLGARSRIFWGGDTLVVVLSACYETLEFWIEYAYLLGTKILCCPFRACRALLIGYEYVLSEAVVCCLSITQHTSILEREPWFVPQAWPCGQTVLKSGLRWSATKG